MGLKRYILWALKALSVVLFVFILMKIDLSKMFSIIYNANFMLIILILVVKIFVITPLRAYKWKLILKMQKIGLGFMDSALILYTTAFVSNVLPGRLGEIVRVYMIKQKARSLGRSVVSILVDRLQDTSFMLLFALAGLFLFSSVFSNQVMIISLVIVLAFFVVLVIISSERLRLGLFEISSRFLLPGGLRSRIEKHADDFFRDMRLMKGWGLFYTSVLSLLIWLVNFLFFYVIARLMSIPISYFQVVVFASLATIITSIPISFSGIGTRDALFVLLFASIGLSSEEAIAFSFIILINYVLVTFLGLAAWLYNPVDIKESDL